jgi:FtsP/CotA-like multicopper oxidase with cupredoxin domain
VRLVNVLEHQDGKKPSNKLTVAQALSGQSADPCVGAMLEFRIVRKPAKKDNSVVPATLIPNPDLTNIPVARTRVFEFNSGANQNPNLLNDPTCYVTGAGGQSGPWGVKVDQTGPTYDACFGRISALPQYGTREVWELRNGGGGWDHPIHIHFEEGQILARNGSASNVPAWEKGRKDVYRLRPSGSVTITMQFRDWGGMFMEHCHNTVHEDNAMLVRWETKGLGTPFLSPLPSPVPTPQGVSFIPPSEILPTA